MGDEIQPMMSFVKDRMKMTIEMFVNVSLFSRPWNAVSELVAKFIFNDQSVIVPLFACRRERRWVNNHGRCSKESFMFLRNE